MTEQEALEIGMMIYNKHIHNLGEKVSEDNFVLYVMNANFALEKQIPMKPHKYIAYDGIERNGCPRCFEEKEENQILYAGQKYCSVCGQKISKE